jgi:hypothetical protein
VLGADKGKVIEAERFIIRDTNGKIRASLELGEAGYPSLYFRDAEGKPCVSLRSGPGVEDLRLGDEAANSQFIVSAEDGDGVNMSLERLDGDSIQLAANKDDAQLHFSAKNEVDSRIAIATYDEYSAISVSSRPGKLQQTLSLIANDDQSTTLNLIEGTVGPPILRLILRRNAAGELSFKMFGPNGKVLFDIPKL